MWKIELLIIDGELEKFLAIIANRAQVVSLGLVEKRPPPARTPAHQTSTTLPTTQTKTKPQSNSGKGSGYRINSIAGEVNNIANDMTTGTTFKSNDMLDWIMERGHPKSAAPAMRQALYKLAANGLIAKGGQPGSFVKS